MSNKKPPIGIEPEFIWRSNRIIALFDAIERYAEAKEPIPVKWIKELRKHVIIKADEFPQLPPVGCLATKGTQECKYY